MAIKVSKVWVGILSWIGGLALTCKNGKKVGGVSVWGLSQYFIGTRTVYSDKSGAIRYLEKWGG